ncbi:MAG TPA: hypothetical protein VKJ83_07400, partial [Actinomycetota bacterium]|nr:hypothetical protein [Actinomycetota bacterium]
MDLGQELLRAVEHLAGGCVNDGPSLGGQTVAPVQVVLPVELGGVIRPPLDLDDHPFAEEAEVDTGNEL